MNTNAVNAMYAKKWIEYDSLLINIPNQKGIDNKVNNLIKKKKVNILYVYDKPHA